MNAAWQSKIGSMAIVLLSNKIRSKFSVTVLRTLNRHETILFYQVNPLKLVTGMAIKHSSDTVNPTYALYSIHTLPIDTFNRIRMIYILCICWICVVLETISSSNGLQIK